MDLLKKSKQILTGLQQKNGGILATPLDGAYPYVYVRDGVMISKALNYLGLWKKSEKFYEFLNKFTKPENYKEIFHRYDKDGWPSVSRKGQHDNPGLILHGIHDTYQYNKNEKFLKENWNLIKNCTKIIFRQSKTGLVKTETSIHELYRLEHGFEIWSNCACCRGLYDAIELAEALRKKKEKKEWKKKAAALKTKIKKKMFNKKTGLYMKNLRFPGITDISQSAPFYFNIEDSKRILKTTVHHLAKTLCHNNGGGFRRFKKFEVTKDWHWYTGGSGGWATYTPWMAKFYKKIGEKERYKHHKKWMEEIAEKSGGFLPEHVASKQEYDEWKNNEIEFNSRILKGMKKSEALYKKIKTKYKEDIVYWAIPLGWSHAEYVLMGKNNPKII